MVTLLELLRSRTLVDCDTLNASVAARYGPFIDCTSNQAIACFELQQDIHQNLLETAAHLAIGASQYHHGIPLPALAVEIAMILLQLQVAPNLTGNIHIQTNPFDSYSTARTVADAERIVSLLAYIDGKFDPSRVCVKIPSTWEGLQACGILQKKGIKTLATTLFTIEQAALAGELGCTYIAPYVNELKVHFDQSYHDPSPNLALCVQAQRYYERHGFKTQVLPASLTSIKECMALAGANHITIAPALLDELAQTAVDERTVENYPSLFDNEASLAVPDELKLAADETAFRMAFTRRNNGKEEMKLIQAINIFCDMEVTLEKLVRDASMFER
ncbi:transaldolase [Lepidopterella palustris CBS 459.81]|uniref:Transaldolase n=1 Tax=Lepidopterella palustris CBS 459.81 TaxID=1314670 RepID=A0A8E2EL71_9PEZI|nr:transaldolase [Lepidopterella palustris CBS 459.81]